MLNAKACCGWSVLCNQGPVSLSKIDVENNININTNFQILRLVGWLQRNQPIRNQVLKLVLRNMDFNMTFLSDHLNCIYDFREQDYLLCHLQLVEVLAYGMKFEPNRGLEPFYQNKLTSVMASNYWNHWSICKLQCATVEVWECISNYTHYKVWDEITYPFPKLQWLHHWSLRLDKWFHPTLYWACDYISMLGLKGAQQSVHLSYHLLTPQLVKNCLGLDQTARNHAWYDPSKLIGNSCDLIICWLSVFPYVPEITICVC